MKTARSLRRITLVLLLAATPLTGCAAFAAALPNIVAAVIDGVQVLDVITTFVTKYFAAHSTAAETQAKVFNAIEKAKAALNLALRTAQGSDDLSNAKVDAAFENFKAAYLELLALVRPLGVQQVARPDAALSATVSGDTLQVPEPLAFDRAKRGWK